MDRECRRSVQWITRSSSETEDLGAKVGLRCRPGDVIGLVGGLGSGKTCFVHGLARGLEVQPDQWVRSPSFTIVHGYQGRIRLTHVDLYRLAPIQQEDFDLREFLDGEGVLAVEWFDNLPAGEVPEALRIEFTHRHGDERKIRGIAESARYVEILQTLS